MLNELLFGIILSIFLITIFFIIILYRKFVKIKNDYSKQVEKNSFLLRELNRKDEIYKLFCENSKQLNKKILIGDYSKDSLKQTISALKSFNIDIDIALSSDDIIDKIKNNYKYDLIITNDLYKHGCDGKTLLRVLRDINGFSTPVIINTISNNEKDYFINICGFDGYLEKPIDKEKLEEVINKYLI